METLVLPDQFPEIGLDLSTAKSEDLTYFNRFVYTSPPDESSPSSSSDNTTPEFQPFDLTAFHWAPETNDFNEFMPSEPTLPMPSAFEKAKLPNPSSNPLKRPQKTAHNVIEKRYRNNLNDRISDLRNTIPSLSSAEKANKGAILRRAQQYIEQLQKANRQLIEENDHLRSLLQPYHYLIGEANIPPRKIYLDEGVRIAMVAVLFAGIWAGPSSLANMAAANPETTVMRALLSVTSLPYLSPGLIWWLFYGFLVLIILLVVFLDVSRVPTVSSFSVSPNSSKQFNILFGLSPRLLSPLRLTCVLCLEIIRHVGHMTGFMGLHAWLVKRFCNQRIEMGMQAALHHDALLLQLATGNPDVTICSVHALSAANMAEAADLPTEQLAQIYVSCATYAVTCFGKIAQPLARRYITYAQRYVEKSSSDASTAWLLHPNAPQWLLNQKGALTAHGRAFVAAQLTDVFRQLQSREYSSSAQHHHLQTLRWLAHQQRDLELTWWCDLAVAFVDLHQGNFAAPSLRLPLAAPLSAAWFGSCHEAAQRTCQTYHLFQTTKDLTSLWSVNIDSNQFHVDDTKAAAFPFLQTCASMFCTQLRVQLRLLSLLHFLSQTNSVSSNNIIMSQFISSVKADVDILKQLTKTASPSTSKTTSSLTTSSSNLNQESVVFVCVARAVYRSLLDANPLRTDALLRVDSSTRYLDGIVCLGRCLTHLLRANVTEATRWLQLTQASFQTDQLSLVTAAEITMVKHALANLNDHKLQSLGAT